MLPPIDDTITARSSARGAAYRGIVRVSGPDAVTALQRWFRISDPASKTLGLNDPQRPCIVNGELTVWGDELPVPCVLYYWPEGRGFTGQQSVELHTIGSQPLLDAVVRTMCESGCRLAGAGEFTLRAFLSGRIDLPQAEAVLGIIDADDRKQLAVALRQLAGGIGRPLVALRERLLEITCWLEAEFDFADEEIEFLDRNLLQSELAASLKMIEQMRQQMQQRASTSERPRVVLIGRPNAGKSSLFNALVEQCSVTMTGNLPSAIVSPQPGTTRDWLEAELPELPVGVPTSELQWTLLDTAGIETVETNNSDDNNDDQPRQLAQAFTRDAIEQAHLVLLCIETSVTFTEMELTFLQENAGRTMVIRTKSDLPTVGMQSNDVPHGLPVINTSATIGKGLPQLLDVILSRLQCDNMHGEVVPATALRCRESLSYAEESLQNALQLAETSHDDLLTATEMRVALEHIGQMTGAVHNNEILDRIFSRFCIGK